MDNLQVKQLIQKYLDGQCTAEEIALLESWYLEQSTSFERPDTEMIEKNEERMLSYLRNRMAERKTVKLWSRIARAAAVVAFFVVGVWFFSDRSGILQDALDDKSTVANDIAPGKNTATITLPDGKVITLSDEKSGVVIEASGLRYNDNTLVMQSDSEGSKTNAKDSDPSKVGMTASTPPGGTYQIKLPDGTRVWLNAASTIKFPSSFAGAKERRITLQGEAYMEVAKDKIHPFIVETNKQIVEVLGTHFNINSYADENVIKTTLLEGSVKVSLSDLSHRRDDKGSWKHKSIILKPGEQSLVSSHKPISVKKVDLDEAMAWKKGYFSFYNEDIASIMRKVARWYNIEVEYSGELPQNGFDARITKYASIKKVLDKLEKTGDVHFKIEGRKVIVSK